MRRVGLIVKRAKPEAVSLTRELARLLTGGGREVILLDPLVNLPGTRVVPEAELAAACDLVVVLGGDGTLLYAAGLVSDQSVPILGVNLGRLGFLTSSGAADAVEAVEAAVAGRLPIDERMRLDVRFRDSSGAKTRRAVVNDAVMSQAGWRASSSSTRSSTACTSRATAPTA